MFDNVYRAIRDKLSIEGKCQVGKGDKSSRGIGLRRVYASMTSAPTGIRGHRVQLKCSGVLCPYPHQNPVIIARFLTSNSKNARSGHDVSE